MRVQKSAMRNREIFAAYQQGESCENLAKQHGLSRMTVDQIIRIERHKIAVSVDAFYEEMRSKELAAQSDTP